ncbi:MAG: ribosome biogenesis GTPase Der [Legionellaceae bacterium]|nr:ribosome biogenesis GTPase Der [Legionellaceae bacterium]
MIPIIALVGRPNVGKSTLFNRLTRTQNALVADFPGLTRDRQYGDAHFNDKSFIVVDTGGVGVEDLAVDELMSKQSQHALDEADAVFFLVDGRSGMTPVDHDIAIRLRKIGKKVFLVVNKVDGLDEEVACGDFQSLGFEQLYGISATHGRGLAKLLEDVTENFPEIEDIVHAPDTVKIAFAGRPNVGKSTLINRILGEERVVVYDLPGTTRDSIAIPFERDEQKYTLIDTAGIRRRSRVNEKIEKFSIIKTLQSIKESNVCLMLLDAKEGLTEQDMHLLGFIIESGKALLIVVNKWDGLDEEHKESVRQTLSRRLHFANFAQIRFISALHGSGVGLLFKDITQAYRSAMLDLSTPKLTRILQDLTTQHTPPLVNSRRIKLRFAHAGGHNPPIIVIHGNQVNSLPDSYKRYLNKAFTEQLGLIGTPLKLEFKNSQNPFKDKKNKLTDRQIKHKQRLLKRAKRGRK